MIMILFCWRWFRETLGWYFSDIIDSVSLLSPALEPHYLMLSVSTQDGKLSKSSIWFISNQKIVRIPSIYKLNWTIVKCYVGVNTTPANPELAAQVGKVAIQREQLIYKGLPPFYYYYFYILISSWISFIVFFFKRSFLFLFLDIFEHCNLRDLGCSGCFVFFCFFIFYFR